MDKNINDVLTAILARLDSLEASVQDIIETLEMADAK